ncbi:MAG: YicC/YloC family endoribonuclease [Desulfobacterales bacterium]|nr:YicC/YloC family endoribonuclease [Desulfobacterales bacterium]
MLQSMTAFARCEKHDANYEVVTEIRSYNSKNLDLLVRLPHFAQALEERIKSMASRRLHRGRVEIRADIREVGEDVRRFEVDLPKAQAYHQALEKLRSAFELDGKVGLEMLAAAGGIIKPAEDEKDLEALWEVVAAGLAEAFDGLIDMRGREGRHLADDFAKRLQTIEDIIAAVHRASQGLLEAYQQRLKERIAALTRGVVEIDPARIAQEAALLADRSDISEEIVRARSHLEQFRHILTHESPAGRKLNFLVQEFNREFNTMGAKTGKAEVSHLVVELKTELEKIREQVQNVE